MCGATIFAQALNTAGDTMSTMIASIVTLLGLELPLSYLLATITGWGVYSRAVATVISTTVRFGLYISFFQWGKWREKKIRFGAGEQMRFGGPRR
jgi:Na+-driven multidrug efflux pump